MSMPSWGIKLAVMGIYLIPTLLALLVGLALRSFRQWQRVCGMVALSTAAFSAFAALSWVCFLSSPDFRAAIGEEAFTLFSDVSSGFICFLLILSVGSFLFSQGESA